MHFLRIKETCLYVTNLEQTRHFYHTQLGLPVISVVEGRHIFFRAGESVLLCFIAAKTVNEKELPPHGAQGSIHLALEVEKENYDVILQTIKDRGIPILHEHIWPHGLRSFYFHDPDGHLIEVIEAGLWEVS